MKKIVLPLLFLGIGACTTTGADDQAQRPDACERYADNEDGDTVVVMRDRSSKTEVAAVGVTSSGGLAPVAGVAGPSVITSRGGALAYRDGQTDVTMEPCAPVAQDN